MSMEAISYLINFQHTKDNVIATLQQIEFHMKAVDFDSRRMKTIGNAISIMGTIAAPFTGGLSLFATGVGVAVNVATTYEESSQLTFLGRKAQDEIELMNKITQKIDFLCVDWVEVAFTLGKAVSDVHVGVQCLIKKLLSAPAGKVIAKIPRQILTKIVVYLEVKMTSVLTKVSIDGITRTTTTSVMKSITKQVSSEATEQLGKQLGKKVILATVVGVCFGVAIDVIDIIRIWSEGDSKALKQIQLVIRQLRMDDEN